MIRSIGITAVAIFVFTIVVLLTFSPLTKELLASGNVTFYDIAGLIYLAGGATIIAVMAITGIIASCMLARRLGYDQMSGLLLLIPVINVIVFFYWAFRESPNEQKLRMLKQKRIARDDESAFPR